MSYNFADDYSNCKNWLQIGSVEIQIKIIYEKSYEIILYYFLIYR